jgi:hypothetical protein
VAQLPSPPLLWRYGCRHGRMTGVISSQGVVPMLLLIVHGHVHPIDGSECRSWEACGSPSCLRVTRAPRARWKHAVGGRCRGSGEVERCRSRRLSCPRPFRKARAR